MEASVSARALAPALVRAKLRHLAAAFADLEAVDTDDRRYHDALGLMHGICAAILECEAAGATRGEIVDVLSEVRAIHARSPFVRRLQEWPRGYPGDFETVEYICRGENRAPIGTLAHTCEQYALSRSIAQQHRNKIHHQSMRVLHTMFAKPQTSRVLSLACGGSADLRRVAPFIEKVAGEIYLNDADPAALDYSRKMLQPIASHCRFIAGNALRVARRLEREPDFDLVIAGGLFDYLTPKHAVYLLDTIYHRLLGEGGTLFFTNIAAGNPYRPLIEYFGDWFLIERSEHDVRDYCESANIPLENVSIVREETGLAFLVEITRR
jgi:SAM-dependent methyltransferase